MGEVENWLIQKDRMAGTQPTIMAILASRNLDAVRLSCRFRPSKYTDDKIIEVVPRLDTATPVATCTL